ncbi:MAG: DUF4126 domain-containing protein [Acidobacteria bacterium]|nr:DUF4126 domain-containing protein [Acidobacteriota bacterium]MCG3194335.1 hypothetical protein [Thermoanaerobaculia bacterium]MCK6681884.1 DUF4126 domain-containing protein [Thermoanaerobaculia bacterium]
MTESLPAVFGTGLGLAAGAGLNAYAVLLVYGGIVRLFPKEFPGAIGALLSSDAALVTLGILFLLEFFADKIPGLDHVWDVIHSVIRPLSGAVLAIAAVGPQNDSVLLDIVAGGSGGFVAMLSHLLKSAARMTSTALTAGVANIALSIAEDILAFLQALVAIFLPIVALIVVLGLGAIFLLTVPKIARSGVHLFGRIRPEKGSPPPTG